MIPQLKEMIETYKPSLLFSDGDPATVEYFHSLNFLTWLYNESPVKEFVAVNDRWGWGTGCNHGGYVTCLDRYIPGKMDFVIICFNVQFYEIVFHTHKEKE